MAAPKFDQKLHHGKFVSEIEWKPFPLDPEVLVSEYGDVISHRGRLLKPIQTSLGYRQYSRRKGRCLLAHRMVLLSFVGEPPEGKPYVAHADCCRSNNHISNLRYTSQRENIADSVKLDRHAAGARHGMAKLDERQVVAIRKRYRAGGRTQRQIARDFGVSQMTVSLITRDLIWRNVCE